MRVRIPTIIVLVLFVSFPSAQAQETVNRFGFFAGLNVANMGGDMEMLGESLAAEFQDQFGGTWTSSKGSATGLGVGVTYLVAFSPTLALQIEGQYVRRGAKLETPGRDITTSGLPSSLDVVTRFKLDYLELPLLLRISPGPGNKARPVFFAGPVIGMRVGADAEIEVEGQSSSEDASDLFNSYSYGLLAGIGLDAKVGENTQLLVQGRYFLSLSNQLDTTQADSKSGDFGFFLGIEFPLRPPEGDEDRPHY